jgi:DNA-binding response OmpR family regulator
MTDKQARILIVDDEPFNLDYLEQELEDMGYLPIRAENGAQALTLAGKLLPDLVLLDVMMPHMDGYEVCRRLKATEQLRLTPVIFMTALGDVEDRIEGISAGAEDFLTKPVDDRELRARIETSLRLKNAVDEKLSSLRDEKNLLEKFVPSAVRQRIDERPSDPNLDQSEQDVSILYVDLSGYTRMSEEQPINEVRSILENWLSTAIACVEQHQGNVNETVGDGFVALFDTAVTHSVFAAECALELQSIAREMDNAIDTSSFAIHIGFVSGPALVGSSRLTGPQGERWVFSATGPTVNLASRLADIGGSGDILLDSVTNERLGNRYFTKLVGSRNLKNIREEVFVHRLLWDKTI